MRSHFYLSVIAFLLLAGTISCVPPMRLLPDEKEQVFSHVVDLRNEVIRTQVVQFINEKFVSGKSVTQSIDDGLITGNAIFMLEHKNQFGIREDAQMELTFLVKYVDNQYKTKCIVKRIIHANINGIPTDLDEDRWGFYQKEINETIQKFDLDLLAYLTKKDDKFKF